MTSRASVTVLCCALAISACSKPAPEDVESESVVAVTTATAQVGTIGAVVHATGLVTPAPGAELIVVAPEPAVVVEIPKGEGDTVRRGDLLVRFDIPSTTAEASKQRAEIARAQARLETANSAQARMRDLFARGVAARREVEDAAREVADAKADLAAAQAASAAAATVAGRNVVRATFDGIVARRAHNPGDLVEASASDAVLRVVDPRRLEVAAQIPLGDAPRVRVGAAGRVTGLPETAPAATLKVVSHPAAVQEGTATVPVRLAFTDAVTYPVGTPVQVDVDAEVHANVVVVPTSAIVREGEETAVFVVSGDAARRRAVTVGLETHDRTEITTGVKAGETVITSNQNGLPDGAKISVVKPGQAPAGTQDK